MKILNFFRKPKLKPATLLRIELQRIETKDKFIYHYSDGSIVENSVTTDDKGDRTVWIK